MSIKNPGTYPRIFYAHNDVILSEAKDLRCAPYELGTFLHLHRLPPYKEVCPHTLILIKYRFSITVIKI